MSGEYSVYQWFPNGQYEQVRQGVSPEEAIDAFRHYISCVGAQIGTTVRVIVTDGGDYTVAEWERGKGIVFPTAEDIEKGRQHERSKNSQT